MARKTSAGPVLKAVIYARVSTKEQEQEGFSIDAQLRLLREYAVKSGLVVAEEFVESESAKRAGRKAFDRMLRSVREGGISHILVEKTDRLYRNFADYVKVDELGVQIHLVKESETLTPESRSHQKMVHGLKVLLAKNYIDNLSEEIRKGMGEKARAGLYPSHAPLGYLNVPGPTGKKVLVPDPQRSPVVKELFETYALGTSSIETSRKLARERGLTTKKGRNLTRRAINEMLRNPIYVGRYSWNGEIFHGSHEPLVSSELFNRVQEILDGRKTRAGFGVVPIAYRGLVRCARCGHLLAGEIKKGKYVYYHCIGRRNGCDLPYVREECLTEEFAAFIDSIEISRETLESVQKVMIEMSELELSQAADHVTSLEKEASSLRDRLGRLYEDKVAGEISSDTYANLRLKYESRQIEVEQRRSSIGKVGSHWRDVADGVFELCMSASDRFKQGDAEARRQILGLLCSNCIYDGTTLRILPKEAFSLILETNRQLDVGMSETAAHENWWR